MSVLSDDTDVLLLIPPDLFVVHSDSEEETISFSKPAEQLLVSDLLSQVNDLEGRICLIESQNVFNAGEMAINGNLAQLKHFGSVDTLNTSYKSNYNSRSLQTTPLKTYTMPASCKSWRAGLNLSPNKLAKSLEQHQNILMSNEYINQKERDDQLLKEIHNFFRNRENVSKDSKIVKENLKQSVTEIADSESVHLSTAVSNLNKVNDLLKQLEDTQAEIEQKLKLRGLSDCEDRILTSKLAENQVPNCGGKPLPDSVVSENSSENKTFRRSLNFDCLTPKADKLLNPKHENLKLNSDGCSLDLNSETSHKSSEAEEDFAEENANSKLSNELTGLLSLCQLWGHNKKSEDGKVGDDLKILKQKYQEEQCRRLHCEELIQKLQLRLLEEQQKVAVAIKVDQEKDEAILKLTEGWQKLVVQWRESESQKDSLAKKLEVEREKFENKVSETYEAVKRYENELSKALDLAHGYKEKCELSEKERKNLNINATKEIEALRYELEIVKDQFQSEKSSVEKLEKLVAAKEENLNQAKAKMFEMQCQIRENKKSLKEQQAELEIIRLEKDKYSEKLKEEKNKITSLEQNKKILLQNVEELKKKEKSLRENMKSMTEQIDKMKFDLKEFYQGQVEKIVQEKLKEFQEQLSVAEKTLQKEVEEREKSVTEMAVKQVQQIVEKHMFEVKILEEKHKEEIELWKIKGIQAEEKVLELKNELEQYSRQKSEMAQKLQSMMEVQWQEALKIIASSSPQHRKVIEKRFKDTK